MHDRVRHFVFSLTALLLCSPAWAANYAVSLGTSTVDGDTFCSGVCQPGDTLTMDSGTRGPIVFRDLDQGTSGNEITIRNNSSGQVVIQHNGVWPIHLINTTNLIIDGTGAYTGKTAGHGCGAQFVDLTVFSTDPDTALTNQACGIKVECNASNDVNTFVKFRGNDPVAQDNTVKGVEVDGGYLSGGGGCETDPPGIGMAMHDTSKNLEDNVGEWFEGFIFESNYIHHTSSECLYLGANVATPRDIPSRNTIVRNNVLYKCGYDGIDFKTNIDDSAGRSKIHGNIIAITGVAPGGGSVGNNGGGINLFESGFTDIYGNWVQDTAPAGEGNGTCYKQFFQKLINNDSTAVYAVDNLTTSWWNNVGIDCKGTGIAIGIKGIANQSQPTPDIFNVTIVGAGGQGIGIDSDVTNVATIQDDIVCDSVGTAISGGGGADVINNNHTGACSTQDFVNLVGRDFHLNSVSAPAYNAGGNYVTPPTDDFDGVSRPQSTTEDAGAFELPVPGAGNDITMPKPNPHVIDAGETHYPDHLWVITEESGGTVEDDGSATDCDLAITGADWSTDAVGPYLQFIKANSDFAESTCITWTGTVTMCAIVRISGAQGTPNERWMGIYDAGSTDIQFRLQTTGGLGYLQAFIDDGGTSNTSEGPPDVTDNLWNMVCTRGSSSILDISVNGSAWDTEVSSVTISSQLDTVALGGQRGGQAGPYADVDILLSWIHRGTKTSAEMATIYNSGNPYPIIGIDPASGPPPVAQRGQFKDSGVSK